MKLMIKLCILVLILGLTAPFFIKGPNGRTIFNLPDFSNMKYEISIWWRGLKSDTQQISKKLIPEKDREASKVYKWQDENGTWHFSEAPNANGQSEEMWVDPDTNVVPAIEITKPKPEEKERPNGSSNIPLPLSLPSEDVQQLIEDANNVQQLMDDRAQQLDEI